MKPKTDKDVDLEAEACAFARELLMPEKFVREEMRKIGRIDAVDENSPKLKALAKRFGVSTCHMAFRLGELSARA
jgi:Zn-dependent peptidase ImmA (M78 family)